MKNFWKKSVTVLVITAIVSLLMPVVVLADAVNCEMLNKPEETKNFIISILEEEIGGAGSTTDISSPIILCFRETKCTTSNGAKSCTSTYKESCTPSGESTICQRVQVIFAQSGAGLLYSYIGLVYKWAAGVIGVVSVLYMVYGGIKIATAGDDAGKITSAKEKIMQSISGLILLFLSAVILYTINPNFFTA